MKKSGRDPTSTTRPMTFAQDKLQEKTVELPLSEVPFTFDEKGQLQVRMDLNLTEDGFADELVTEENLLRRVASVDLYPEAIEAVQWVLKFQVEQVVKTFEQHSDENTDITPQLGTYMFGVQETCKHLALIGQHYDTNEENVLKFANCIKTVANGFDEELVLCQKILNKLEDFMWAQNNYYAESKKDEALDSEIVRTIAIGTHAQNLVGVGASLLDRVNHVAGFNGCGIQ